MFVLFLPLFVCLACVVLLACLVSVLFCFGISVDSLLTSQGEAPLVTVAPQRRWVTTRGEEPYKSVDVCFWFCYFVLFLFWLLCLFCLLFLSWELIFVLRAHSLYWACLTEQLAVSMVTF